MMINKHCMSNHTLIIVTNLTKCVLEQNGSLLKTWLKPKIGIQHIKET